MIEISNDRTNKLSGGQTPSHGEATSISRRAPRREPYTPPLPRCNGPNLPRSDTSTSILTWLVITYPLERGARLMLTFCSLARPTVRYAAPLGVAPTLARHRRPGNDKPTSRITRLLCCLPAGEVPSYRLLSKCEQVPWCCHQELSL